MISVGTVQQLHVFTVHSNHLSGTLRSDFFPPSLVILTLHTNRFHGPMPPFSDFLSLNTLTAFENNFRGVLTLPQNASSLSNVLVHRNRLSCDIGYNRNSSAYNLSDTAGSTNYSCEHYTCQVALLSPGNRFSAIGIPSWAAMSKVPFLWEASFLKTWREYISFAAIGTALLLACVLLELRRQWRTFFIFHPQGSFERLNLMCTRMVLLWSVGGIAVLVPLYVVGSNQFECGSVILSTTLAYLADDSGVEWAVSVMACIYACLSGFIVATIIIELEGEQYTAAIRNEHIEQPSLQRKWMVYGVWLLIVFVYSTPGAFYAFSLSIPGDTNTFGFSTAALEWAHLAVGPLVHTINALLVPLTARWLTRRDPDWSTRLILFARCMVVIIVPFTVLFAFGQDCQVAGILFSVPNCFRICSYNQNVLPSHTALSGAVAAFLEAMP